MKKGFLLLGVIFLFGGLVGRAQIYEMYSQDFETGTPVTYSVIGNGAVQTTYQSGGSRAMKLTNNSTSTVILLLDTVDFTSNAQFNYYTLEFMHICYCEPTMQQVNMGGEASREFHVATVDAAALQHDRRGVVGIQSGCGVQQVFVRA